MHRRELRTAGLNAGLVLGAGLVIFSVNGLIQDRDYYKAQAQAPRPTETVTQPATPPVVQPSASVSATVSGPSPTPSPRVVQAAATSPASSPPPASHSPVRVTATPTPRAPSRCPDASLLTLHLPLTLLPCNAVSLGGSS